MTGFEIALFVLGTAFIIISFFIVENRDKGSSPTVSAAPSKEELQTLKDGFLEDSAREADILLQKTEDKMESLSNEKIMAVGEYSDQVIEKINENHREVVFMYEMLQNKEKELKSTAIELENSRIECEKLLREKKKADEAASLQQKEAETLRQRAYRTPVKPEDIEEVYFPEDASFMQEEDNTKAAEKKQTEDAAAIKPADNEFTELKEIIVQPKAPAKKKPASAKSVRKPVKAGPVNEHFEKNDSGMLSKNDEIIALHKKGKSVMEISKLLGMGQGEVKLIIDLYC